MRGRGPDSPSQQPPVQPNARRQDETMPTSTAIAAAAAVVLNHNGRALLLECLQSLMTSTYANLQIVVVDNGSNDGSAEAVESRFPSVRVIRRRCNAGVAGGRNTGIRWVRANLTAAYIIFLDNDTQVEPHTIGAMIEAAEGHSDIGMVAPKAFRQRDRRELLSAGGMRFNPYTGALQDVASGEDDVGQYDQGRDIQACPGFAFLVRASVIDHIGGFDDAFNPYGWEDVDFSLRAARAGFRIVYTPAAVVYHAGGRVGRGIVDLYERHKARNMFYFVRRHTTPFQWMCFLAWLPFRALARIFREILAGNAGVVATWLAAWRKPEERP
jgi:GT2 family glycosyltransferase